MRLIERAASAVQQQAELAWAFRMPLLVGAGLATGTVTFVAGPWIAETAGSLAGSLAGFTTTTAVQLGISLRRMLARFTKSET
jgi:hypothetical protein